MNFGFNSNVRVGDTVYHVQTEDRGPAHPFLDTFVYLAGRVVYKRSTSYEKFARGTDAKALSQKLHQRLAQQHREVIAELEAGNLPASGKQKSRPDADHARTGDCLNLRLLNPKSWLVAGNAILKIEVSEAGSGRRVGEAEVRASLEHEKRRTACAEMLTDSSGGATLQFPLPPNVAGGSSLVICATDGLRHGELRFRLKLKTAGKTPEPVAG